MTKPLEERIYDGEQARAVLENEAFGRAFDDIKTEYIQAWENVPQRDKEGREQIWLTIKLLAKLKLTLEASLNDGKLAKHEMLHKQSLVDQAKHAIGLEL